VVRQVLKFRRARSLACYWDGEGLIVRNYFSGHYSPLPALAAEILTYCHAWQSAADVCAAFEKYPARSIRSILTLLADHTLLERSSGNGKAADRFDAWAEWMPEAAFFHFATKHVNYVDASVIRQQLLRKARHEPPPAPVKRYRDAPRIALPSPDNSSELAHVLRSRRTWRRFANARVSLPHVSTLLALTWGVQRWMHTRFGPVALKTAPSGGARHPIEAYVLARRIEGLRPGWYHYDADAHALERLPRKARAGTPAQYLPHQVAFRSAPAVFVMSAVFARTQWAYKTPRAYRVVLLDAGHLGQTFCLVATALGLAPFCSAALADARLERDLGLDGVNESVVYACGVGVRPAGLVWGPRADVKTLPRTSPPLSARKPRTR
jgi:SagB-type dehydrogenase family enzyme